MSDRTHQRLETDTRARTAATVVGATFLLVGILGFVPGITSHYDQLSFAGHESEAELLGLFQVSILHNLLHLALGLVGLVMARRTGSAVAYLVVGGLAYLALWVWGLAVDPHSDANLIPLDDADNWLHLILGAGITLAGACPGTTLAQIGAGYRDARFTLVGGLFGAVAYSYAEPTLSKTFLGQGGGKLIFSDLAGIPYWMGALILAAAIVVILVVLEKWRPWRPELGNDVDGDVASTVASPTNIRIVPAE